MEELEICGVDVTITTMEGNITKIDFPKDKVTKKVLSQIYDSLLSKYVNWV
jgi:hypothetical protein